MAIFKPETKAKIKIKLKRVGEELVGYLPWIAGGMLIGGYIGAIKNSNDIQKINNRLSNDEDIIDNNARASKYDRGRIEVLERQNNLLMEKALSITEGRSITESKESA